MGLLSPDLEELMAQFGANEQDRKDINKQTAFMLGFSLLGGRKGQELQTIGNAGMNAVGFRQQALAGIPASKLAAMGGAAKALELTQQLRTQKDLADYQNYLRGQGGGATALPTIPEAQTAMPPQFAAPPLPPTVSGVLNRPELPPVSQLSQATPQQLPPLPQQAPTPSDPYTQLMQQADAADAYARSSGNQAAAAAAAKLRDQALKWRDENTGVETVMDPSGNPILVQRRKYGGPEKLPYLPKPEMQILPLGNRSEAIDKLRVKSGQTWQQGIAPDAQLSANVTMRGQNMTDARARDLNAITQGNAAIGRGNEIRKEFNALPQVKAFNEVQPVLQSARDAIGTDTAAADLNLIYAAAKVFDPASVVRESETTMVVQSGSPAERFKGQFNYVAGGGRLTPTARAQLMQQIESRAKGHESAYASARKTFETVAKKQGVAPEDVFIEPSAKPNSGSNGQIVRRGTNAQGKRVVQYVDGTIKEE